MSTQHSRRDLLRGTLALTGLGLIGFPEWALPALAQGEELVPFTDLPPTFNPNPRADTRLTDVRKIDGPFTPKDQFYTTQHYGHPVVDPATFRLKVTGLVNRTPELWQFFSGLRASIPVAFRQKFSFPRQSCRSELARDSGVGGVASKLAPTGGGSFPQVAVRPTPVRPAQAAGVSAAMRNSLRFRPLASASTSQRSVLVTSCGRA